MAGQSHHDVSIGRECIVNEALRRRGGQQGMISGRQQQRIDGLSAAGKSCLQQGRRAARRRRLGRLPEQGTLLDARLEPGCGGDDVRVRPTKMNDGPAFEARHHVQHPLQHGHAGDVHQHLTAHAFSASHGVPARPFSSEHSDAKPRPGYRKILTVRRGLQFYGSSEAG